jgi:ribonuclease-3 family protein
MTDLHFLNSASLNPDDFSPAVWAYIGDAVYELFIRCHILTGGPTKTKALHQEVTTRVRASFQAELIKQIEPYLTEMEIRVMKRGRNIKSGHTPNNTDVITYRHSTAFEALIGYLYLSGQWERLTNLLNRTVGINSL